MDDLVRKKDVIDALHEEWDEVLVVDESGSEIANCCEYVIDTLPPIKLTSGEISETKKKIVIGNYYESDITKEMTLKQAFTRGFELGLEKAPQKGIEITTRVVLQGKYDFNGFITIGGTCENCSNAVIYGDKYCSLCDRKLDWENE